MKPEMERMAISDNPDFWKSDITYVIGHQRPDTDSIASALAYAWYLAQSENDIKNPVAARTGQVGPQATFALQRFDVKPPVLLTFAAPAFHHAARPQEPVLPDAPLSHAIDRLAAGVRVVPIVGADGKPVGALSPNALAKAYAQSGNGAGIKPFDFPCKDFAETLPTLRSRDRISDYRNALLRGDGDDFIVVNELGVYVGMATQRRILEPPRAKLVLVDHNEISQAVSGAEEADIIAVLDHHRLDNHVTATPIPFVVEPVGSTCTLVAELCERHDLEPPRGLAGLMLSGILSDTLVFRSPTTTRRDSSIAHWLAGIGEVELFAYGAELLNASPGLGARTAAEIMDGDRKVYDLSTGRISIGQVEVTNLEELAYRRAEILALMEEQRQSEGLIFIGLMVTDVVDGRSHLLAQGSEAVLNTLPFARTGDHQFDLEEIVSRKKQLLPALYSVLDESR